MADQADDDLEALPPGTRLRVIALVAAALGLVFVIVWLLSGGGAELFKKKFALHAFLSDGGGLARGADVRLNGVNVGKVTKVGLTPTLDPNRIVRVDMQIQNRYEKDIPIDSIAALTADNILGDKYVNITAGKGRETVADGAEIASLIQNGSFNPADLVASLQDTLARVDAILTDIQQGNSPLAQFIRGSDFYQSLQAQVDGIQKAVKTIADPNGSTGQLLFGTDLYNQIRQPILNIDRTLEQIQRGENPAGRFLNDPAAYDHAVVQVRELHQSIARTHQQLESDAQYEQLRAQIHAIDQAVDNLTKGDGAFAQMLQTSQLYDNLAGKSASARDFAKDFRQNPQKYLRIKIF
jgi:phospholipid/cholesterol/gamma-HCH transport system substrate-binding protein